MTLIAMSELLTSDRPDDCPVARSGDREIDFAAFRADVAHNATRLRDAGCRRGIPSCQDSYWFLVAFFALLHAGAVPVIPANVQSGTLTLLASEFDLLVSEQPSGVAGFLQLEPGRPEAPTRLTRFDPDLTLTEFFTSGTSGQPKRITKSVRTLERESAVLDGLWGAVLADGLMLATVPHHHIYGLAFKLLWPISRGTPFAVETHELWETVFRGLPPGGALVTSPAHLTRLSEFDPLPVSSAPSMILSAGAPLPMTAARRALDILRTATTEIFGSTETGAFATRRADGNDGAWTPLTGIDLGLTEQGRLKLKGAFVDTEDWYETSDLADLTEDGGFRFRGRSDRVVKIEGKRISLTELEAQIAAMAWVERAAAVVLDEGVDVLAAAVVLTGEGGQKLSEMGHFRFGRFLRRGLADRQEAAGLPRYWRFVDDLPSSTMGKRRDSDIAALFSGADVT